ncbi:hypothetical protein HSB1_40330 [Halogranum salarium B-1]|uniref:Uncharacterized protein n=1 Tax=Halogranum salarium B-1 TaxID=1210908 RepID=J3ETX4_9EURY|nr:hypothetical protein HSB1_40330 [Halogranum salarium B-1]
MGASWKSPLVPTLVLGGEGVTRNANLGGWRAMCTGSSGKTTGASG